jgi:hypothetical protein
MRYAHCGKFRSARLSGQTERAWYLSALTNDVATCTADYLGLAVAPLRAGGRYVNGQALTHISQLAARPSTSAPSLPGAALDWPDSITPDTDRCAGSQTTGVLNDHLEHAAVAERRPGRNDHRDGGA